jgi:hypothetical protein
MSTFRRRVDIAASQQQAAGEVRATLEDDFHHFRVKYSILLFILYPFFF